MQVYLVGGAIRDELLGLGAGERDWVVTGATPAELEAKGFRAVGREFPVFLHPESGEEYALARLERKVAPGYRGFQTEFSPAVTLEEDLLRRDLTVNAMARGDDGRIVDPYGGQRDLAARLLRHVSPAFSEDPVRILRVARFAARFAPQGFTVAPETMALMRQMVADGEVRSLVAERVWRETARALESPRPAVFFEVLRECGALASVMPELQRLLGSDSAPPPLAALECAAALSDDTAVRWAALLAGMAMVDVQALQGRLRVPREPAELAVLCVRLGALLHAGGDPRVLAEDAQRLVALLEAADAWRRPQRFARFLLVLRARAEAAGVPQPAAQALAGRFAAALERSAGIQLDADTLATLRGPAVGAELRARRIAALR
jgi:tRNA nucleotidyltransferase (CCA-adding enzyme)